MTRAIAFAVVLVYLITGPASARPRLDPRLQSLRIRLAEERAAGVTPRTLAARSAGSLFPGLRVAEGPGGKTLGIDCLMKLEDGGREALRSHGIQPRTPSGSFVTVTLTPEELETVADLPGIAQVEMARELRPTLDVSAPLVHATEAHGGPGPDFPVTGFTGRNVVLGIIDTGVDIRHDDFKKPNGRTRVKYAWDQLNAAGPRPLEFGIGTEWTESQINSGAAILLDTSGHGTHVAGIAAGDGSATGNGQPADRFVGIAPEADLIVVKTTFQTSDVIDAIDYVFSRAGSRDAVINLSLGTQDGPHDGTSVFDQAISDRIGPGRIIVAAAGNESGQGLHARLSMSPGTDSLVITFDVPSYTPTAGARNDYVFFDGWYEGTDNFSFVIESPSGWRSREIPNNNRLVACTDAPGGEGRILIDNNNVQDVPAPPNGDKELYLEITDYASTGSSSCGNPAPGIWRLVAYRRGAVVGPGNLDLWATFSELGGDRTIYPRFLQGASNDYLVGSPASAPRVLSVGAFISKRAWLSLASGAQQYQNVSDADIGKIASFSSPGPLRDGTIAPNLSAPGMGIGAARSSSATFPPAFLLPDGKHVINQGTSQASPHVAGTVALILERCPHLTPEQLLARLTNTAVRDAFTGSQPNRLYGYGKLNALAALNYETESLACAISGEDSPDLGATVGYTDNGPGPRSRRWSVVSVPEGIATIVGSDTAATVQVHFTGNGSTQLVMAVSDPTGESCRTVCKKDLDVGLGFFSEFEAVSEPGRIRLHWHLLENVPAIEGFHVLRAGSVEGPFERITTSLLTGGPDFEFIDTQVAEGKEYWYFVEARMAEGGTQRFGPLLSSAIFIRLHLSQNGPNPFSDETLILYSLPAGGRARLDIFDLGGRRVRTLFDTPSAAAGDGQVRWDGRTDSGEPAAGGLYFYQLTAGSEKATRKMMLVRR